MKKSGILHPELARVIASLGHGDGLCIADAGLPVPAGVLRIDLALAPGLPAFLPVLEAILGEMAVESAVIAEELPARSPAMHREIERRLGQTPIQTVAHERFKQLTAGCRAVVRTGEFTPYANIILKSGVVF
ncbi:MAG: D-ribose pyranase [Spirochaetes bacterium RBG_16_67_19]|nr:MAG: D-ribose pyranase [Spirochaetes bacterium RBG_16_67_19]